VKRAHRWASDGIHEQSRQWWRDATGERSLKKQKGRVNPRGLEEIQTQLAGEP
jgi:hypothetical protein